MNEPPIFVTGFSRGGTTILMNMLASHPDVCTIGEIHQVFKGSSILDSPWQVVTKSALRDLPVILASGQDLFSPRNWEPRKNPGQPTLRFIQAVLEKAKRTSGHAHLNRYKAPDVEYSSEEIEAARMLGKTLDGMVYTSDILRQLYPQAEFVGIIRNGFAVCEGHVRRGRNAREVGRLYRLVIDKIFQDHDQSDRYRIIRFEDLMEKPVHCMRKLFVSLHLAPFQVMHIRMQQRRKMNDEGRHELEGRREWDVRWLSVDELSSYLDPDIDGKQIRQLSHNDKNEFLSEAGESMERMGYWKHASSRLAA